MTKKRYTRKEKNFNIEADHEKKFEIEKGDEKWIGEELEVTSDKPLEDAGTGDKYSIRTFYFKFHPDIVNGKKKLPTKQELFNAHLKQIELEIWKDGMAVEKHQEPQLKYNKEGYAIGLLCGVSSRTTDSAMTLQEILKN